MRFLPTAEQSDFARTLRSLLGAAQVPTAVRAWADGEYGPGLALRSRLAGTGLFALAVPEAREELALAVDAFPLCREDCRGLCPRCGADLNRGACSCVPVT